MNFLQKLFYTGTRCSRCGSPLQSAKGSSAYQRMELNMDFAYECDQCHDVICGTCYKAEVIPSGCRKCGSGNVTITSAIKG